MRGKVPSVFLFSLTMGITPAYAGKSSFLSSLFEKNWITPAYAGKSSPRPTAVSGFTGSPPRMRGKVPFLRL